MTTAEILALAGAVFAALALVAAAAAWLRLRGLASERALEEKHRAMLVDLQQGLAQQAQRLESSNREAAEVLRGGLAREGDATRTGLSTLQLALAQSLGESRTALLETLAGQARAEQALLQDTLRAISLQLSERAETMSRTVDARLEQISGKVNERLDEGFRRTNETFVSVMQRLQTIDEAQKQIERLSTNVVSLQELLGDKRSRGAFGEVQLEALVRNVLPSSVTAFQHTLSNGTRVDCMLFLPAPTGNVAVDAKFPLENYHRSFDAGLSPMEREMAQREFARDVKKHVDDIAGKYILPGETADGAVMFVPAEAVFAEIHAHNPDVVDYALERRVWIVSPTTLMAILNTARAVLKDVEMRQAAHLMKDALMRLAADFERWDTRMQNLAKHIDQVQRDVADVHTSSRKIASRFRKIERVELDGEEGPRALAEAEAAMAEDEPPVLPDPRQGDDPAPEPPVPAAAGAWPSAAHGPR